jgi:hypothetical protein
MATTSGAVIARIISQYSDKGSKAAQKDIAKMGKKIDDWSKRVVKSYAIAGTAVAAFAVKLGKDAVQGAMEDQKQQAALATALRNTTNATDAAIQANQEYLDGLELQVAIDNNQLIPALQQLVTATGDLGQAQSLLTLSTDLAAASNLDLGTVSGILTKAVNGNVDALKKLKLPLDQDALAAKDLGALLVGLANVSKGQAAAAANTFAGRLETLRLKFAQVADRIGYALMPAIEEFATYLMSDVIPNIEEWVTLNETKLQDSFKGVINTLYALSINIVKIIGFLERYKEILIVLASIPLISVFGSQVAIIVGLGKMVADGLKAIPVASGKIVGAFRGFATAVGLVTAAFRAGGFMAALKGAVQLFMMLNPYVKIATGLFILGAGAVALFTRALGKSDSAAKKTTLTNEQIAKQQKESILNGFKQVEVATAAANAEKARTLDTLKNLKAQQAADAAARKRAKFEADYAKLNATLAKRAGVSLLSSDDEKMVQINAAIALADRQKEINKLDKERLERMKDEIISMKVRNDLAARYQDILKALADSKIDTKEIAILAKLWEVPVEAVEAYLVTIFAVEDATITDDEIVNLAMKWGSTQEQAAKYLDFFTYLNDGFLSDAEIEKLKTKWKMTEEQVRMYADFVGVVNDGKLTDAEIVKIQDKWKLTTDQVVEYIKQIGSPVSYSGSLIDPAKAAEIGWLNATAALQRYLDLLKAGTGVVVPNTITPPVVVPPVVIPPKVDGSGLGGSRTDSAASAASAIAYAVAKAAGDSTGAALAAAGVTPSALASQESGAIGAASIAAQLAAAEQAVKIASSLAAFKAKEAQDLAASQAASAQMDYDERFRFNRGTVATASTMSSGNLMAGGSPVINVTVQGSVTSEQDLVTTIRNGLLSQQYNGDSITLQAV